LAKGVRLIEYDKSHHKRDRYPEKIKVPSFFYREGGVNKVRPEKLNMEELINYPLPGMYEITNVNLYVEPQELIDHLKKVNQQECL
jgi:hypothetical protein